MIVIDGKEVRINRETAVVSEVERVYCELCEYILKKGLRTHNRTGVDTKSIANWQHIFDISEFFPIMETKLVNAKNFASEIQWIHQVQSNVVAWLQERGNHIWDKWVVDEDGIYRIYEQGDNAVNEPDREVPLTVQIFNEKTGEVDKIPARLEIDEKTGKEQAVPLPVEYVYNKETKKMDIVIVDPEHNKPTMIKPFKKYDEKGNELTIKEAVYFGKEYAGTIGEAYGFITGEYKMPQCVEYRLKYNPTDRRMIINLLQNGHLPKAVLPSCVFLAIFKTTPDGKLHSNITQRSADVPVGVPFNFAQYALLTYMFAKANGYKVGTMAWNIQDTHIYVDQIKGINKQLQRYKYMLYYSNYIQNHTDEEIEEKYYDVLNRYNLVNNRVFKLLELVSSKTDTPLTKEAFEKIPMSKRYEMLEKLDKNILGAQDSNIAKIYENMFERKICFEHMLTRENPVLEVAQHDSFFDYSTDYVEKGDPYLKENPIGNKDLVLKGYHPTPFISMPVAQ